MWPGLRLFSPATYSSLPGWMMPAWDDAARGFPPQSHVVEYLTGYEDRYDLRVRHGVQVTSVAHRRHRPSRDPDQFVVATSAGPFQARVVVSATGTWSRPFWPTYPGADEFAGRQLHAAQYRSPEELAGMRVLVVGGGNSAAQILAEVSEHADTVWVTNQAPTVPARRRGRA